MQKHVPVLK